MSEELLEEIEQEQEQENKKKPKIKRTIAKRGTISRNLIKIIGSNILYNNGIITAYYIVPLANNAIDTNRSPIQHLRKIISTLYNYNPNLLFTIEKIKKPITRKNIFSNNIDTIHVYRPSYSLPTEFINKLANTTQEYCILGINMQQSSVIGKNSVSMLDAAKSLFKSAINVLGGTGNLNMDPEKILSAEEALYKIIDDMVVRADQDFVFYNYISKVYPSYDINFDKLTYINEKKYEDIMASINQSITDNFGYFEMKNDGIDFFGLVPRTTYGCMLSLRAFPKKIDNIEFSLTNSDVITTIKCVKKEDYHTQVDDNDIICQFNINMIVYADSLEDLKLYTSSIIEDYKTIEILASKSLAQSMDFLNLYINRKPKDFDHTNRLDFPLTFQQNA